MTDEQASDTDDQQNPAPRPVIQINAANVPPELHFLIPYAEKWGIVDRELLDVLMDEASAEELEGLNNVVSPALKDIDEAVWHPPLWGTPEALIFRALVRAKRVAWLKMTGWPENYPNPKINPDHMPLELHPLIPYAESGASRIWNYKANSCVMRRCRKFLKCTRFCIRCGIMFGNLSYQTHPLTILSVMRLGFSIVLEIHSVTRVIFSLK
jgi:hypothetical protein